MFYTSTEQRHFKASNLLDTRKHVFSIRLLARDRTETGRQANAEPQQYIFYIIVVMMCLWFNKY